LLAGTDDELVALATVVDELAEDELDPLEQAAKKVPPKAVMANTPLTRNDFLDSNLCI
jgi:hypothetical protein